MKTKASLVPAAAVLALLCASPCVAQTTFTGAVDNDINNAGNWDNGLPTNDGANDGTVPTGFPALTGSPLNKNITFEGDSGFTGNQFGGNQANGYNVVFNGTGNADFTGNGLFLGWDDGAQNNSSFEWNSSGTAQTTRLFTNRFAAGSFTQSAGTINQNTVGNFDMIGGEFNNQGGTAWTMSGGTFNSLAGEFEMRHGTMTQTGGDIFGNNLKWNEGGGTWVWNFSGGTVNVTDVTGFDNGDVFNFTAGSTGVLNVTNANYSITDAEADINAGRITLDGAATTPASFDISVVGPNTVIQLPNAGTTVFTGAVDNDIGLAGNWDNGLPTNDGTKPGIVPDGFPALFGDPDGKQITFEGNSGYDGPGFETSTPDFDITFNGTGNSDFDARLQVGNGQMFAWNSSGTATAQDIAIGGFLTLSSGTLRHTNAAQFMSVGPGSITVEGGRLEVAGDLRILSFIPGILSSQSGGSVVVTGELSVEGTLFDPSKWTLSDGTTQAGNLSFLEPDDAIDFPTGSNGVLNILTANKDVTAMQAFITAGNITYQGASSPLSNFVVEVVDIGGTDYTQVRLSPAALQNLFNGSAGTDINNAANWDIGLPTNDGTNDGIVPDGGGFTALNGSPQNKNITFEGDSGFNGNNFGGAQANGFDVVFNGTGDSDFTGNGLFLAWDGGANNESSFEWNKSGTLNTTRFFIGRFGVGNFVQTDGIVNQNNTGVFDFIIGELAGSEGSSYTMSGGVLNAMGELAVRRGSFVQSGGEVNAMHANGVIWNEGGDLPFTWTLSGGTLRTANLLNMGAGDVIDFPDGSTGKLQVLNSVLDPTALQALVTSGNITKNGAAVDPGEFTVAVVDVGGVNYTELLPVPATPLKITDITISPDQMITLTWTSRPGAEYTLFVTRTLTGPEGDLGDDIASQGETTTFGPFPNPYDADGIAPFDPLPPEMFFTVQEN